MLNKDILEEFMRIVPDGKIMDVGLSATEVDFLRTRYQLDTFDIKSSRFRYDPDSQIKKAGFVKFPYDDNEFDGIIVYDVFSYVGDREYFFRELNRICDGPILMFEFTIEAFPLELFEELDDYVLYFVSLNGGLQNIDATLQDFFTRPNYKRIFYRPGGSLNRYEHLVPVDEKVEVGLLCQKQ